MPKQFDHDMAALKQKLLAMAGLADEMVRRAIETLATGDMRRFEPVKSAEERMDVLQREVDEEAVRLIAVYTPVASDLRELLVAARVSSELERVSDQAMNIGFYVKNLLKEPAPKMNVDVTGLADAALEMLKKAAAVYTAGDSRGALELIEADDRADILHDKLFNELMAIMGADHVAAGWVLEMVLIIRSLERICDHAVNIAEDTVYVVEGRDIRHVRTAGSG